MPVAAWLPAVAGVAGAVLGGEKTKSMAAPLISGGLGLTGSLLSSKAVGESADLQYKAAQEALQFEREREAARQRQWEADQRRLAPYRQAAASVLAKYGIEVPLEDEVPPPAPAPGATGGPAGAVPGPNPYTLGGLGARGYGG